MKSMRSSDVTGNDLTTPGTPRYPQPPVGIYWLPVR